MPLFLIPALASDKKKKKKQNSTMKTEANKVTNLKQPKKQTPWSMQS